MTRPRLVLATHNSGKLEEIRAALRGFPDGAVVTAGDLGVADVVEDGLTYRDNATLKALAVTAATGLPALADDSGLDVDAMNGMPGVLSARWSGSHGDWGANNALLLAQMSDVKEADRTASYVCTMVLTTSSMGVVAVRENRVPGHVTRAPRGERGFGYDPVFVPEGSERTVAEMSEDEWASYGFRSDAVDHLAPTLRSVLKGMLR